jgi:hypothetical protein
MEIQGLIEVVDFEHDIDVIESEAAEIVLLVGIVRAAKVVKYAYSFDEALDRLCPESGDACCDDGYAAGKVLPELVVEQANSIRIRDGHGWVSIGDVGGMAREARGRWQGWLV